MSTTKLVTGLAIAAGLTQLAISAITPPPPPMTVHSLAYTPGVGVVQDRTVEGDAEVVLMNWAAQVVSVETGNPVPGCTGSGSWPYAPARRSITFSLETWVGSAVCTEAYLLPGEYYLRAIWTAHGQNVTARSEAFEVRQ